MSQSQSCLWDLHVGSLGFGIADPRAITSSAPGPGSMPVGNLSTLFPELVTTERPVCRF